MVPESFTFNREPHIKVGQWVVITKRPLSWASGLYLKAPMSLEYPVKGIVKFIGTYRGTGEYIPVTIAINGIKYGFSYDKTSYHLFRSSAEENIKRILEYYGER